MDKRLIEIAAQVIGVSIEDAEKHCKPLPEINAFYFWNPIKGSAAVIVSESGEKLGAASCVSFEQYLEAFKDGKRT